MPMEKNWFEMNILRRNRLNNAVWIPLYACQELERRGQIGYDGYKAEFFGCGTLAVPIDEKKKAAKMGWDSVGIGYDSKPWINEEGKYLSSDVCTDLNGNFIGLRLALVQEMELSDCNELFLHQDFILALGLKREGDTWVRPEEGYIEVAHIKRDTKGSPIFLEVRAEHLKDYLRARKMALLVTTYRERVVVTSENPEFDFGTKMVQDQKDDRWVGYISEIHEGGLPFGAKAAIVHLSRNDVDFSEDIPTMGEETNENIDSSFQEKSFTGKRCYRISGELWKNEWIEPSEYSPRVAHDKTPAIIYFITDAAGHRENKDTLIKEGRWLWFDPSVVNDIIARRGSNLQWYTAQTGEIGFLQSWNVHFGINPLGLINVYAKDIAKLPDWIQQIWAGHNTSPDGKVSSELLESQVKACPANTQAPEDYLPKGIKLLNELSLKKLGFHIIRETDSLCDILKKCHRFRCTDRGGLYALAKDLARIIADSVDGSQLQKFIQPPAGERWGSLKSLEKYLGTIIPETSAKRLMGPLFAIYDLRLADAHLPKSDYGAQFQLLGVHEDRPFVWQGYEMLHSCVSTLYTIIEVLNNSMECTR